jgi:lysophospholipid acyltransferase (LPLAT)-like uncharacterized protein
LIYLAARTELPIVPIGLAFNRPWRARSWDRFALPRPGRRAICITAEPIRVPPDADRDQLEKFRQLVEQNLLNLTEQAERLADQVGQDRV